MGMAALQGVRICDFTGQLAGAGATRWLAAFGAEVIRIEDPVRKGRWDILRGNRPFVDDRRGIDLGGAFNNHNVEKRGITLNLKTDRGKELLAELVRVSDVVAENFAAGVLERLGFGFERLQELRSDIIYVSNCGFGHSGPYAKFKTWGPIVQAISGLTFSSGLKDQPPAGWGYSYMDHTGGYYMAMAILMALIHRQKTGEGQWVDLACTEAALSLNGPALLDWSVNGRAARRSGQPDSNRSQWVPMAPHGIYRTRGDEAWIAIAVRDDSEWAALADLIDAPWCARWTRQSDRLANEDDLDRALAEWTLAQESLELERKLLDRNVPAAAVRTPQQRIEEDPTTADFGLWPEVEHGAMGRVRVDGYPVHLSETDWRIERGGPCLGEHNEAVLTDLLGVDPEELPELREAGVI